MVSLGDRSGFLTWAAYVRWPIFAGFIAVLGVILGLVIGGLIGAVVGLIGGGFLGGLIGGLMGKNKAAFPIVIDKWLAYSSGDFESVGKYVGRVITQSFKDADGGFIERRIVEYLDGTTIRQLPNFSLPVWFKDGETRKLKVLQVDSHTFYPLTVERGALVAHNVPVYYQENGEVIKFLTDASGAVKKFAVNDAGEMVKNEQNKPIADENGKYIPDVRGEPLVLGYTRQTIFDSNVFYDDEDKKVKTIPKGLAAKLDNERVQYTNAIRIASEFNKFGGFWNKYGNILVAIISVLLIAIIVIFGLIKMGEASRDIADSITKAQQSSAASNLEASKLNAHVANALIQVGYNRNATREIFGDDSGQPSPTPAQRFQIPFVGG